MRLPMPAWEHVSKQEGTTCIFRDITWLPSLSETTEPFKLENASKTTESNHEPNTAKRTTKPCSQALFSSFWCSFNDFSPILGN